MNLDLEDAYGPVVRTAHVVRVLHAEDDTAGTQPVVKQLLVDADGWQPRLQEQLHELVD